MEGGEPISLCDAPASRGGSWGEDGNIIAALDQQAGLSQVPSQGGEAVAITKLNLEAEETTHRWPQILPGGKAVLFLTSVAYGHYEDAGIAVLSLKDRRTKTLLQHAGMYPRYLPSGHLVYVTKRTLFAAPFDLDRLEIRGAPAPLWEVAGNPNLGFAQFDFSRDGTLVYRTGGTEGLRTMQWLDGSGKTVSLGLDPAYYNMPRLSPDGSRVAYMLSQGAGQNLWIYDFERGIKTRLADGQNVYPVWTPDGRFVVFQGLGGMFWTRADGAGKPQALTKSKAIQLPFSFSRYGPRLAYSEQVPGAGAEIRTIAVQSDGGRLRAGDAQVFLKTTIGLSYAAFSPDGRWLAFADAEGGQYEIYVRAFPDNGTQVQISNAGGVSPVWSRNGNELFYRTEDQRIMVANYTVKGESFVADKPRVWFAKQLANIGLGINFDLAPDGKRVLVVMPAANPQPQETQNHVMLVTNFFDEVRRSPLGGSGQVTMPLSAGTRLGPYEILAPLGAGGMGEVYRARDPRMGREVAIKVSAERFSDRFEREVHAVAALNHPNICHVYDVGPNYLVMELVEGPTLAERIKEGAMPLEQALPVARQIADALEAAHEKGIVHRDLKPANIKIKPDGVVKVLDFGLAKIAEQMAPGGGPESSPTIAMGATIAGQILGTAAYMAPEQARGKAVDKRADIWAFGVVLYEMLTGRRLFAGETVSDTLAAVLKEEPEWDRVPVKARRLVRSCLQKDPKQRLHDIADAKLLLEDAPVQAAARTRLPWAVAAVLALIALWALWRQTRAMETAPQPVVRLDLDLGPDVSLGSSIGPAAILTPEGTRLVFVSQGPDRVTRLFTRRLDQPKATRLSGTEGAYAPFFSPDGQWIGFFALGKLKKTRIDGGEPVSLCDAPAGRGASWGEDGNIVATLNTQAGLSLVSPEGGKALPLTELSLGELSHRWAQVLPEGKAVVFNVMTVYGTLDEARIELVSLKDHRRKTLLEHAGMYPRYLPSGHLIYLTKGSLFAVPFDPDRLEVRAAARVLEEVSSNTVVGSAQFDFSRNGTLAYRTGGSEGLRTIQWLDGAGKTLPTGIEPAFYIFPRLSPDGKSLAILVSQGSSTDLWIHDLQRGHRTRLTKGIAPAYPVWSPDGRFVVFQAAGGMFWTRADGAGDPQPLTQGKTLQVPNSFTPDGTRLVFSEQTPGGGGEIQTVPVESGSGQMRAGAPRLFLKTSTGDVLAAFSPDGRWLAYGDAVAGRFEVYVRAFPDKGARWQLSNTGGTMPVWSRNGHELFFRSVDQRIMVADYTVKSGNFEPGKPRVWSAKQLANLGTAPNFDLAPDGKRFIVLMSADSPEPEEARHHIMLVTNFFDEVRRRLAAQGK